MRLSALAYYARSIPKLLFGFQPLPQIIGLFLGKSLGQPLTITLRASGLKYRVRTAMDVWVIKETCLDRDYERGAALQADWTIIDIGAGLGDFTAYAAWRSPNGTVLAFEPFPESFALLEQNLQLNNARNVEAQPYAVADTPGKLLLNIGSEHAVQHTTTEQGTNAIEVPAITLDSIFADQAVTHCDLLKMDVEGAEYGILLHASADTLRKIKRIALEYHDHTPAGKHQRLRECLTGHGFQVTLQPNPVHDHLGYLYAERRDE
ncbi:MAG: FkbM family methyltransferase [Chloroflexi bacterium]|nr:FkbM family methyltransferase [Chloroflexota bacterium]